MQSNARPVLYSYWRSSCSWRVRLALQLKGIEYEYRAVNLLKGEHKSDEYKKINAASMVPSLVFLDGPVPVAISQSISILEYLEEAYPTARRLLPNEPLQRAHVRHVVNTIACDIQPLQNLRILHMLEEEKRSTWGCSVITNGLRAVEELVKVHSGKYCIGDEVTLADVVLVPQLYNASRFHVDMDEFPTLVKIAEGLAELPEFVRAHANQQPDKA